MSAPEVSGKCPEVFQRHAEAGRMSEAFFPLGSPDTGTRSHYF